MQKWEYLGLEFNVNNKKIYVNDNRGAQIIKNADVEEFWALVHDAGLKGWELVSVQNLAFYFKRPVE